MTMTDPIADMLTRVRNANSAGKEKVAMPSSKKLVEIARIMQEEGYVQGYDVIDGAWLAEGDNYAVVHRAMTADKYRGTRLARDMFSLAFDLAAGLGKASVRVDTHRDNRAMNRLASEKLGFTYCGEVDVSLMDPGHDSRRNAYEKLI